ncbi:MAG: carboxypeptidase regulatory-like domain-containing protein [Bacteroidota bacterium]
MILTLLLGFAVSAWGQGATTSTMSGRVLNTGGQTMEGASVLAIHTPTGSKYGAVVNSNGYYRIYNMQVGGPYRVVASYVGYADQAQDNVYLSLGQTYRLDMEMSEEGVTVDEVLITSTPGEIFDGNRTGSETYIGEEAINNLPTVSRDFLQDFGRLTPQANLINGGISLAGTNNRFNAIFIDGAVNNDVFGLANSGTNGGQAGISPISPDALEQVQIVLAPYDVKFGGFAGGGVNAVTRSGTNQLEASAYYFLRNEQLAGKTPGENVQNRTRLDPFTAQTYGFRVGGPIIKDKLFFFTNVEIQREQEPKPFTFDGYEGDSDENDLNQLIDFLKSEYNYDPGGYKDNISTRDGEKILLKLDWNINDNHKLSARHSYVRGRELDTDRPNSREIHFFNSGVDFPSITNSSALELKSTLADNISNDLILGFTSVRDDRDIIRGNNEGDNAIFPRVEITDGNGVITVGTDAFSLSNIVNQDVLTLTNNLNIYQGNHTFTFGTHNELFRIQNLFVAFSTPLYFYNSMESFMAKDPAFSLFGHEQATNGDANSIRWGDDALRLGPTFNALQLAFYAQDEIQVNNDFKLTLGLRADVPVYLDDAPAANPEFNQTTIPLLEQHYDLKGAQAGLLPKTTLMLSPRIGFNYDVGGLQQTQIRGGVGIFTSRIPWVWPGGVYIRTGMNAGSGTGFGAFTPRPEQWRERAGLGSPGGDVDLYTEDFKYPQVFRGSLGFDQKLPGGMVGTLEASYTKTLNNIDVKSVNLKPSTEKLIGADDRPIFDRGDEIDPTYSRITLVDNTNAGYTYNITAQLQKPFSNGLIANLAYSYTDGMALFDGTSFINASQWRGIHSVQGRNNPVVARSFFATGSRVSAWVSKRFEYAGALATTISLFYNGQDGQLFSYTYANGHNLTNEDSRRRALIYIPQNQSDIVFADEANAAAQWAALDAFIEGDEYLRTRRGDYAERNGRRTPFENLFDLKIVQDLFVKAGGSTHAFQVTFDVFNVGNMLNSAWGKSNFVGNDGNVEVIRFEGFANDDQGNPTNQPTFSFQTPNGDVWDLSQTGLRSGRWSSQLGIRYLFN